MVASSLIMAVSAILFVFWFRYTCLLILSTRAHAANEAIAGKLSFTQLPAQQYQSAAESDLQKSDLQELQLSLSRDYRMVTSLLRRVTNLQVGNDSMEQLMLRVDFQIMDLIYRVSNSRSALAEMSNVVLHLAHRYGERSAALARM